MTNYQHPWDAPSPLCPPPEGINTVPNNPTWFAFIAWCTSLTLDVHISNCLPNQGGVLGVQIAIYSNCNTYTNVACDANSSDCGDPLRTISMNNLEIGNTYYFMIDGCLGSYCDILIDVVGVCGEEEIDDWTEPVDGPTEVCVGESETYSVEDLDGATDFHWYIDGVLISEGPDMTTFNYTWNTTGTYELCVDASNDPCIPESDPPPPNCITIEVFAANAGMIDATPTPVCPGETVSITATGYESGSGYEQYIVVVDASGTIVHVVQGDATTFTHDECAAFTAYSFNYHESGDYDPPQVGDPVSVLTCDDSCCDTDMAPFEFVDTEDPVLLNVPADLTLTCYDLLPPMPALGWTDNCDGSGTVAGEESGMADICNGGVLIREWSYTDACGNEVMEVQMITINPTPLPAFVNPPANITVDCNNIPMSAPSLTIMNSGSGQCAISAVVVPVQNGTPNICGGTYSYTWSYTDFCNRTVTHVQTITITPVPAPVFGMTLPDVTVSCDAIPAPIDLSYTNGGTGNCEISGTVAPVVTGSANICGGTINYNWVFTDQCNRTITESQRITVLPADQAMFINPPPDTTIMCADVPASFPNLAYDNGMTGSCAISGSVGPQIMNNVNACGGTITLLWRFTDACNRNTDHTQVITVDPGPIPAWINPPPDTMVDCAVLPLPVPSLSYTNGITGPCAIAGSVPGVQTVFDVCNGIVTWQWQFTDPCGNTITHTRNITTVPPPPVVFLNPPNDTTVMCADVPFNIPSLTYTNNGAGACAVMGMVTGSQTGNYTSCGGQLVRTWQVTDPCGTLYTHTQTINVLPAPPTAFTSFPPDITVNCNAVPAPMNISHTNGQAGLCAVAGNVPAIVTGSFTACGGSLVHTWTFQDLCGNTITHSRTVTVLPAPPPLFVNPPADVTLNCEAIPADPPSLSYSNNQSGPCSIAGSVVATVSGSFDACGGAITYIWNFTDACGTTINHIQQVAVLPAADPQWVNPPADTVLGCDDVYLPPEDLFYTNNLPGSCLIEGSVGAEVIFIDNVYTHTWTYTHPCSGAEVTHEQTVTIVPIPEIDLIPDNVIVCDGDFFDLSTVVVTEVNGQEITVTYHTDFPPDAGNQLGDPNVLPDDGDEFVFLATNAFGCTDVAFFTIYVDPLPNAGDDESQAICSTEGAIDFTDYLSFDADLGGYWIDLDGAGVDLDNPTNVSFQFVDPGTYHFQYVVQINDCPADTSVLTIILSGGPQYAIDSVFCTDANTTYAVVLTGSNLGATFSHGTVTMIPGGFMIAGIPIGQQLTFDIWDLDDFCVTSGSVNPPNCDCPQVPAPVSLGNQAICVGEPIPFLEVTVSAGTIAHWYDAASGGTLLASNTTMYMPGVMAVGTYTYYVEAESEEFPGCVSNTRTPVTLTIHPLPVVNDLNLEFCDTLETGMLPVNLNNYKLQINSNPANTLTFHATQSEAEDGVNPLAMPYTVSLGTNIVYARILNGNGCVGVSQVQVILHGLPAFTLSSTPETCLGANDGVVMVEGLAPPLDLFTISFDGWAYSGQVVFEDVAPGVYPVRVLDVVTGCFRWDTVTVGPGITISLNNPVLNCDDNGTDTDPTDDFYTIQVTALSGGATMSFELFANGVSQGIFNYGSAASFTMPANGTQVQLIAVDVTLGCADTLLTGALNPCSSACDITIDSYSQVCDDNGTPLDPSDDFHTITFTASAVNGSVSNQYGLYLNGMLANVFTYGAMASFILPVNQPPPSVQLQDVDDAQCFISVPLQPLTSCSNLCDIPAPSVQYTCDDNNTPEDPSDDFYTIIFIPMITNAGPSDMAVILVDGSITTTVANGTQVTLTLPADGMSHSIEIQDQDDPTCTVTLQSILLNPCSTQCIITLDASSITCDDNGTPADPTDDTYVVTWNASVVFGSAGNTYRILLDGSAAGTGMYGTSASLIIPADGMTHTIRLQDADDANCIYELVTPPLVHCSNECTISVSVIEVYCDNNGTNQTETDDVFFIVLDVTGVNIPSATWELEGTATTGMLGQRDTIGPFLITAGTQSLTFNAQGANCSDQIVIDAPPACSSCNQTIDAGPDMVLDCGTPNVTLTVVSSEPGMPVWTDPSGGMTNGASVDVSLAGQYIATMTFPDGCVSRDTVQVMSDPTLPAVWGGPDMQLNCDVREVTLTAQVQVGSASSFEWTNAGGTVISMNASVVINTPGTYFVRIFDQNVNCWSGRDAVVVADISNSPSAVIFADPDSILSCQIQSIILSTAGELNVEYTWLVSGDAVSGPVLEVLQSGTYTLIAVDTITLCQNMDSITIDVLIEYPVINIEPPGSLSCAVTSVTIDASESLPDDATGVYTWTNTSGDTIGSANSLDVTQAGTYVLELIDPANGCVSYDTVIVADISVFPDIVDAGDVNLPCDVNTGSLSVSLVTPLPGVGYVWQTSNGLITGGANTTQITYSGAGTYIVTATHTASQCSDSDTIVVNAVTDMPSGIEIMSSPASCEDVDDGVISLGMITGGTPPYAIFVNGIETTDTELEGLAPGVYTIHIEDANGCTYETAVTIIADEEVEIDLETSVTIKPGDDYTLEAVVNVPPDEIESVQWSPSTGLSCDTCLITTASPDDDIIYTVTVTDKAGCTGVATVRFSVAEDIQIFIPNVISPNFDYINDFLTVFSNNTETIIHSLQIFDRWGELIFEKTMFEPNVPELGWDGTFRGKDLNPGVFVYKVEVETRPGLVEIITGDVTLVR